jgi:outer membrane receptor protein involved in Fe transport
MQKSHTLLFFLLLLITNSIFPQSDGLKISSGDIKGKVFDKESGHTIEYANIVLLSIKDSSLINGTVTDSKGNFTISSVPIGNYLLEVRFIGYKSSKYKIEINSNNRSIDLGNIFISPNALELKDIVVEGERSPVTYQIDKKVIDVDKIQTVISGNAADVLQNVPSVTVDIEGNVSLRGSTNFTVLIDGKPSVMNSQDALQQIPASSIQNIEIITNPSAKYNPEGTAGIINIILKTNENLGLSGVINGNVGLNNKYGGDFLFQYKTPDINYIFGLDYNKRNFPGTSTSRNTYYYDNSTSYLNSNGNMNWGRTGFGLRGGLEFNLGESDFLSTIMRYGTRDGSQNSSLNYISGSFIPTREISYINMTDRSRNGQFVGVNLTHIHKFDSTGHEIKSEFNFGYRDGDEYTLTKSVQDGSFTDGRNTKEFGPSRDYELKIDYSLPFSEKSRFEAGLNSELELSDDINEYYELNLLTNEFIFQPLYSNTTKYNDSYHAIYTTYNNEFGNIGIQLGFRTEYTYRTVKLLNQNQELKIDRWDYFPSIHSSYKFSEATQLMASYTRRIQRPHGWELEPFYTWMDANNVRIGNPGLLPEFIDSYETGIQTFIGRISFSAEFYHRFTKNKIDRIRSVYAENVNLNSVANIGKDYSTGSELMMIFDLFKFWNVNLMGNLYNYKIEGVIFNEPFSRESFNWSTRFNNLFKLNETTQFQMNVNYNSPGVSAQGNWEGFFTTDVSVKQDLFEKKLSLTLQIRDLFSTAKREFTSSGPDFYNYTLFERKSPMVMLNARINLNNYKSKSEQNENQNGNNVQEEF